MSKWITFSVGFEANILHYSNKENENTLDGHENDKYFSQNKVSQREILAKEKQFKLK